MFTTNYSKVLESISLINPVTYSKTRNYLDGSVTKLSPYLTRGMITLPLVRDIVLEKYTLDDSYKLIQELAWREYFQKVWLAEKDDIFTDLRFPQESAKDTGLPEAIIQAETNIMVLDGATHSLYETGYIHNHTRMSIASIVCNLAKHNWRDPSKWMYYHLLDGDLASNTLSWQWIAGTSRAKQYTTCQSLINHTSRTNQSNTWLDFDREDFFTQPIPKILQTSSNPSLKTDLPANESLSLESSDTVYLYHPWHLDPTWRRNIPGTRILVLEPSHFDKFPVSSKVIDFIIKCAKENIPGVQIYIGEASKLSLTNKHVYSVEHPCTNHFPASFDSRQWLFPEVTGYYKSFFSFWKDCEKYLR